MTNVSATRSPSSGLGAPTAESSSGPLDPASFMRLLVAQIRNQDPLQPMDTTAMMTQLTQLTQVERLVAIDGRLLDLSVATASVANAQAADLAGRTVEADTSQLLVSEGSVSAGAFELDRAASQVRVEIRDASGLVVRTLELGPETAGPVRFEWDAHDEHGGRVSPGRYRISVVAADADGNEVDARTAIRGVVDAVSYEHGYPELEIGGAHVLLGDVRSVARAEPQTAAP